MMAGLATVVASVLVLAVSTGGSQCPSVCRCLWKSSKMTVECTTGGLAAVPGPLDSGTQVLNMTANSLATLGPAMFAGAGLLNLQKICVAHNSLASVHSTAFSGLLNLVEVDLSHNALTSVPSAAWAEVASLMILSLSHNPITSVGGEAFSSLRQLTKLDLSGCRIQQLASSALQLPGLERLYLDHNLLRQVEAVPEALGQSLHGLSLHDNPWHCDCGLRPLRDWLVRTNVARLYEPVCHSPPRLSGFTVTSLAQEELACLPSVAPTSMVVSVREGRNVSLVCRVRADPAASISWRYNGLLVDSGLHPRLVRSDQFQGSLGTRSQLVLTNTSLQENGSFLCVAENKAGRAQANYSVQVEPRQPSTLVMEMRMEHFIAVSVCVIVILVLLMIIVTILLVKIARKHLEPEPAKETAKPYKASSMPRSIQMGTGAVFSGQPRPAPDLLSGTGQPALSHSQSSSDGSMVSVETVATPLGQEPAPCRAQDMRDIIRELGSEAASTQPLIGHSSLGGQLPSWSVDNPYLHTSSILYRQRLPVVRPDQQYPILQYPSPDQQYPVLQYPQPTYPLHTALEATAVPRGLPDPGPQPHHHSDPSPGNTAAGSLGLAAQQKLRSPPQPDGGAVKSDTVISDSDTVTEMLNKLQGKVNKDEEDSREISDELENAFPSLDLAATKIWDSEGTRI